MPADTNEYIEARSILAAMIRNELIGPGSEDIGPDTKEEIITDSPIVRYSSGMIFPQGVGAVSEEDDEGQNTVTAQSDTDETLDSHVNMANQYKPSAIGISFYAEGINPALKVEINTAKYRKLTKEDKCIVNLEQIPEAVSIHTEFLKRIEFSQGKLIAKYHLKDEDRDMLLPLSDDVKYKAAIEKLFNQMRRGWKRIPLTAETTIPTGDGLKYEVNIFENLDLVCFKKIDKKTSQTFFTVSVVNRYEDEEQRDPEMVYFQINLTVRPENGTSRIFSEYKYISKLSDDPEAMSYKLLYRNKQQFATGHGCSVGWEDVVSGKAGVVFTNHMPVCEVPRLGFSNKSVNEKAPNALRMKFLSDENNSEGIITQLNIFCETYGEWIQELDKESKGLSPDFLKAAEKHIDECKIARQRIKNGIELIEKDEKVFKAFVWANRAMYIQRKHADIQKDKHFPGERAFTPVDYENDSGNISWRPFQLAFILLCLNSINDPKNAERDLVDLIWFSTAGGKTEAYLGLTAFTIFLRRLKFLSVSGGTAVIMRYTLRLLTSQQFQRATTLTCACELIRQEKLRELGKEPISIGLWIGSDSSPNSTKTALYEMEALHSRRDTKNPFQLLSCPWCGTKMIKEYGKGIWGYKEGKEQLSNVVA